MALDEEKIERRATKTLLDYWQLLLVLGGGIVACVTFYNNVKTIVDEQKAFKLTVDARRDQNHKDMEDMRTRLTKIETDMEWIKNRR